MSKPKLCLDHAKTVASMFRALPHLTRGQRKEITEDFARQHCRDALK